MAGEVIPKLEQVLEKLENLERYVKAVDEKVSNLQAKVDCFDDNLSPDGQIQNCMNQTNC